MLSEKNKLFIQFRPMLERAAWNASRAYKIDVDDTRSFAYILFCVAYERYDAQKASFSTHLTHQLRHINNMCAQDKGFVSKRGKSELKFHSVEIDDSHIDSKYDSIKEEELFFHSINELSHEAKIVLRFILARDWDIPGVRNWRPRLSSTVKWFKYSQDWPANVTKRAWEEIAQWWKHR